MSTRLPDVTHHVHLCENFKSNLRNNTESVMSSGRIRRFDLRLFRPADITRELECLYRARRGWGAGLSRSHPLRAGTPGDICVHMPQHAPEIVKLSYITTLKFHHKIRTKENCEMRSFIICAFRRPLSGRTVRTMRCFGSAIRLGKFGQKLWRKRKSWNTWCKLEDDIKIGLDSSGSG